MKLLGEFFALFICFIQFLLDSYFDFIFLLIVFFLCQHRHLFDPFFLISDYLIGLFQLLFFFQTDRFLFINSFLKILMIYEIFLHVIWNWSLYLELYFASIKNSFSISATIMHYAVCCKYLIKTVFVLVSLYIPFYRFRNNYHLS